MRTIARGGRRGRRGMSLMAALAVALLSGCAQSPGVQVHGRALELDGRLLGEDARFQGQVLAAFEPPAPGAEVFPTCGAPQSACFEHPFEVTAEGDAREAPPILVRLQLAWGDERNDFDLILLDEAGEQVAADFGLPPGREAHVSVGLPEGSYTAVVAASQVVMDEYDLAITFG